MTNTAVTADGVQRTGMVDLRNRCTATGVTGFAVGSVELNIAVTVSTVAVSVLRTVMVARIGMARGADDSLRFGTDVTLGTEAQLSSLGCMVLVGDRRLAISQVTGTAVTTGDIDINVAGATLLQHACGGHLVVQDIDTRLITFGVTGGAIELCGINCHVTIGTGSSLCEAAVVMALVDRRRIRADMATGTIDQCRLSTAVTGGALVSGGQLGRMVHFRATVFHRLGRVTRCAVEIRGINAGMAIGTVASFGRSRCMVHRCFAILGLVGVTAGTIKLCGGNGVTCGTIT